MMNRDGCGGQSWLDTVSGASNEMMSVRALLSLAGGIEYGKISAWQRQVDSVALI